MRRVSLHIVFWVSYILLTALIEYLWAKATMPFSESQLVITALVASLFYSVSKIIFSYYVAYYALDRIIKKRGWFLYTIFEILVVFFICIIIDRLISNYLVAPYAYHSHLEQAPLLEPRRTFIVVLYAVFAAGLLYTVKSVRGQLAAKEREKNLVKEKLGAELKFLRNQTNPHFLLNTLNNIYALARKKSDDTAEVVMRLSELLRFMLYESGGNLIALTDEIKVLEDYLELEMIRYSNRLSVSFTREIDSGIYQITPLLLLPFLENAFKHGVSETRFESFINMDLKVKDARLYFEIANAYDPVQNGLQKSNIGLINARRQLEITYSEFNLEVTIEKNIFKADLFINLNSYVEI